MTLKLALGLLSFAALAQTPSSEFPPVKGLVVTSTVIDPMTHEIKVGVESHSDKTIVAYGLEINYLDANGITTDHYGVTYDWLSPDGDTSRHILPGQPASIIAGGVEEHSTTVSVRVTVAALVYLDGTYEGPVPAGMIFDGRMRVAAGIRKDLAQNRHTPAEKSTLEKRAAFLEAAAIPKEGK